MSRRTRASECVRFQCPYRTGDVAAVSNFGIDSSQDDSGITIRLAGELDNPACAELLERFDALTGSADVALLVLDLSAVSFIDSAGMRAIIAIERRATERGILLSISPPAAGVTELLKAIGIADHVTLAPRTNEPAPSGPFIERIELDLPRDPHAPALARAEVRAALPGRISDSDRATLTLLTSELVTNAVIHPGPAVEGSIDLRIIAYPDRVRVEVGDAGGGFDLEELPPRPRESGGHGLIVVEGLSSRWGSSRRTRDDGGGFCVWFELELDYQAGPGIEVEANQRESTERRVATAEDRPVAAAEG
jgi:anti-anti-sigma factor